MNQSLTEKGFATFLIFLCFLGPIVLHADESGSLCNRSQAMLRALSQQIMNFDCKTDDGNFLSRGDGFLRLDFKNQEPPMCGDFVGFGSLRSLEISGLSGEIPECMLSELVNLNSFTIVGGGVTSLPEKLFSKMKRLTSLTIVSTSLSHLPDKIFSDLNDLMFLSLNGNQLESIDNLHLERLPNLLHLTVDNNRLTSVPVETLRAGNLRSYQYLENPFIGDFMKDHSFSVCQRSVPVRMALEQKFKKVCGSIRPSDLASVMDLNLRFFNGDQMSCNDLIGLTNLRRLRISGYRETWLDCFFKHNQNILELELGDSSILSESPTLGDLKNLLRLKFSSVIFKNLTKDFFTSMPQLRILTFESSFDDLGGPLIKDSDLFANLIALKHLELSSLELTELPESIFAQQFELISLQMHRNRIKALNRSHFRNLTSLRGLSLAFNHLTTLPPDLLYDLANLKRITFEGNAISEIPAHFFSRQIHLREVTLSASVLKIPDYSFVNAKNIEFVEVSGDPLMDTSKAAFKRVPQVIGLPESFGSDPADEWEAR